MVSEYYDLNRGKNVRIAVLLALHDKWCNEIFLGRKLLELRKSFPNLPCPFTVYVYKTKEQRGPLKDAINLLYGGGKVVGAFVCDGSDKYTAEFVPDGCECYEDIRRVWIDDDGDEDFEIVTTNERYEPSNCELCKNSCLTYEQIRSYVGTNFHEKPFYAWYVKEAKLFENQLELCEFRVPCRVSCENCKDPLYIKGLCDERGNRVLIRPPQSWCYVEEL